ncbi:MAG: hypothetical protein Q8Q49_00120 [bacterium]|nr:hypothetical protein [bacterium]
MQPAFYDPNIPYEENDSRGPALLSQNLKPKLREITKKQKFLDFEVNLPFGIPSGPLLNSRFLKAAFEFGFDVNHYKTRRSIPFPVNQFPNVLFVDVDGDLTIEKAKKSVIGKKSTQKNPSDYTITNSFGNPSQKAEEWQHDMKKALTYEGDGQLLIASAVGTIQQGFSDEDYYNDFALTARLANETGVKVIEVNLSCPNVASEGILCYSPDAVEAICRKSKEAIGSTHLLAKAGYFSHDQQEILEKILKKILPFISGIAAINTIPAAVVDERGNQALPGKGRLTSGICGAGIKWAGVDMVKRLSHLRDKLHADFAIIGVGGVMTPDDYLEYRAVGADCVQSATGAMWNPYLAYEIWKRENNEA